MNKYFRKLIALSTVLLIISSLLGCSSVRKETTSAKVDDSLTEFKNGDRFYKSEVVPTTEAEKVIAEDMKIQISDEYDKFEDVYEDREAFKNSPQIYKNNFKAGYYTEEITIHNFSKLTEDVYANKESGIKYYYYSDKLKEANPYEVEVIEVNYTNKLTEEYDKGAQWPSGTYTRYYVVTKKSKDDKFKIFDIYGHM